MSSPRQVGPYALLEPLGRGGMGVVWRARHQELGVERALKLLSRVGAEAAERLAREARLLAGLRDSHLVGVHDSGVLPDGRPWLCMELVAGESLERLLARGRPPLERALALTADVARGVAALHRAGVVHRDLKPQNVLVGTDGRAVVVDLGLALVPEADDRLTRSGAMLGTLRCMAPEQLRGERERQGPWTDVYALGLLLHELLTGRPAYDVPEEGPPVAILGQALDPRRPRPSDQDPELPAALDDVVARATALLPSGRYVDGGAFLSALERVRAAPGPTRRALRRRRALALGGALLLALGALGAAWAGGAGRAPPPGPERTPVAAPRRDPDPVAGRAPAVAVERPSGREPVATRNAHEGNVLVAFQGAGAALSAGQGDRRLRAWVVQARELVEGPAWDLPSPPAALFALPRGGALLVLRRGEVLRLVAGGGELAQVELQLEPAPARRIDCAALSPDGALLALGELSRQGDRTGAHTLLLELETGRLRWQGPDLERVVQALAFSADGRFLIEASGDSTALDESRLCLREVERGEERGGLSLLVKPLCLCPGDTPQRVLVGTAGQHVLLCDLEAGVIEASFDGGARIADAVGLVRGVGNAAHSGSVYDLLPLPDGRLITCCAEGRREPLRNELRVWDRARRALLAGPFERRESGPHRLAASPEGAWLLVGGDRGGLELWDLRAWAGR